MNSLIAWFARNTVAANMLMVGIIFGGMLSFMSMGKEVFPTVPVNYMGITVTWPGASPKEVEEQIIIRIEDALADMHDIERIQATAGEGFGRLTIESDPKADLADFLNEVKTRMDGISGLPRDIEPPRVERYKAQENLLGIVLYGDVDEKILKRYAKEVQDQVSKLPGAADIQIAGTRNEEVSIELSEEAMRRYGLTFDDVSKAVRSSSVDLSGGIIKTATGEVPIRARNIASNQDDFNNIIIRQTEDGGTIRVGDVATVVDGFEDQDLLSRMDGEPAVLIMIKSSVGMNVVKTSDAVHEWVEKYEPTLPEGLKLTLWWDSSENYKSRLSTISWSAVTGLVLVFIILIISLRPKVAMWVTIGIFTAYMGAFIVMPANDVTLNILSMFGFLLVLGVVVDDAIVIGESIHHEAHVSGGGLDSAIVGAQLVAKPVFYAVITTMLAFMPWLLLSGIQVQFTRHITITILGALTFSLIEAFFILPAHLSKLKPRVHMGRLSLMQKSVADGIVNFAKNTYRPFAYKAVKNRYLTAAIFIIGFAIAITLTQTGRVNFSFMPEMENDMIQVQIKMPQGTTFERSQQVWKQISDAGNSIDPHFKPRLREDEKVIAHYFGFVRPVQIEAYYDLEPSDVREISTKEIGNFFRTALGDIPDAEEVNIRYTFNDSDPDLRFAVFANDMETLQAAVKDLEKKLMSYDEIYYVINNINSVNDELHIELKPGAEKMGFNLQNVSRQVRQAYYGDEAQRLARPGGDVKVMVRYPLKARRSLDSLQNFYLRSPDGNEVPLMSVVDLKLAPGIKRIQRRDRMRSASVKAGLPDSARKQIQDELDKDFFPEWEERHPGVTRKLSGQAEGQAKFLQEVVSLYLMAFFAMYAVIAIAFRSYFLPLAIMTAIPFAYMGSVFGHYIMDMKMALFSFFGIAAAAGVVVNDNLVLVDYANKLKAKGVDAYHSAVEAATARFRPILLTSLTTIIGLMPLMLDDSLQLQDLKPTVVSLSFGVFFAFFITLFFVPALYGIGEDMHKWFSKMWSRLKGKFRGSKKADQAAE